MGRGVYILRDQALNKGTAFTEEERDALGLRGLLPPGVNSMEEQCRRVLENFRRKPDDLERYLYLIGLQDSNETLFYKVVLENIEEMLPVIYTPTVGRACLEYGRIFQRPRGLFISARDRGRVAQVLRNWPHPEVRVIVVTDGERILGLGDLGASGMGIAVGKTSLYTACGGIEPSSCLPVTLDAGTDNEALREDPLYIGIRERRLPREAYLELFAEFIRVVREVFPSAIVQCEDFATANAFLLLELYRSQVCLFNDDIQGTAAVALGGLYSSLRLTGGAFKDQRFLFLGAGEAGIGIGELLVSALADEGLPEAEARRRCWFVDSRSLVVEGRSDLSKQKRRFAHSHRALPDFLSAVKALKPSVIIGVSGQAGAFSGSVLKTMGKINRRPIVFALSNPTSKSECTAEEAYRHTEGRAIFASGSPFAKVSIGKKTYVPGQCNNVYIYPGIGLGASSVQAKTITDSMFLAAAKALAAQVLDEELEAGMIYPAIARIREVSLAVAVAVARVAFGEGSAGLPQPADLEAFIRNKMYVPEYPSYV